MPVIVYSVIINDCLDVGSQIPWVQRGTAEGFAVILLNPNDNHETIDGVEVPVRVSQSA